MLAGCGCWKPGESRFESVSFRDRTARRALGLIYVDLLLYSPAPTATRCRNRPGPCHAPVVPYRHGCPQECRNGCTRRMLPQIPAMQEILLGFCSHRDDRRNKQARRMPRGLTGPPLTNIACQKSCLIAGVRQVSLPDMETWWWQSRTGLQQTFGRLIELTQRGGARGEPNMHTGAPLRLRCGRRLPASSNAVRTQR